MLFGEEHHALRASLKRFVETEINPYVEAWEEAKIFPAHELFKKLGDVGFLGITKPVEYGFYPLPELRPPCRLNQGGCMISDYRS